MARVLIFKLTNFTKSIFQITAISRQHLVHSIKFGSNKILHTSTSDTVGFRLKLLTERPALSKVAPAVSSLSAASGPSMTVLFSQDISVICSTKTCACSHTNWHSQVLLIQLNFSCKHNLRINRRQITGFNISFSAVFLLIRIQWSLTWQWSRAVTTWQEMSCSPSTYTTTSY